MSFKRLLVVYLRKVQKEMFRLKRRHDLLSKQSLTELSDHQWSQYLSFTIRHAPSNLREASCTENTNQQDSLLIVVTFTKWSSQLQCANHLRKYSWLRKFKSLIAKSLNEHFPLNRSNNFLEIKAVAQMSTKTVWKFQTHQAILERHYSNSTRWILATRSRGNWTLAQEAHKISDDRRWV